MPTQSGFPVSRGTRPGGLSPGTFAVPTLTHLRTQLGQVHGELWMIFSLFVIAALVNLVVSSNQMVLGFYTLPTLVSAYQYGRRHATLTAFGSVLLVTLVAIINPDGFAAVDPTAEVPKQWLDLTVWGGNLVVTGYLMGTLCDHREAQLVELRSTYNGVLLILRHFMSSDGYTENHCYRVSVFGARIATAMRLSSEQVDDIRAAALLHDIGKLDISRELLQKAARLSREEAWRGRPAGSRAGAPLEGVGGSLLRVIPIILALRELEESKPDTLRPDVPIEARVIAAANVYDELTTDRPYRKALDPREAKEILVNGAGREFDALVVDGFVTAFNRGELEPSTLLV